MDYPEIYLRCINVILESEGGYTDDPQDPGGKTNFGLSQRSYPDIDIRELTKEAAIEIYYKDYWIPMNVQPIPIDELTLHVFDHGINTGQKIAVRLLQRLVGVSDDGYIGEITLKGIDDYTGNIVDEYIKRRKLFYVTLVQNKPELRKFLKGWLNRIDNTKF